MLLPYDLTEWIPENDIVHFVIEAAETVRIEAFTANERGSGTEQYHPHMLLGLLLYCYTQGVFSSRKIERATYKDIAVRYLCGNQHPDHDTICDFRVRNETAIAEAFLSILKLAKECGILKVGTVSIDGTKINANASINRSIRYDRAQALEQQLSQEIDCLMVKAKEADASTQRSQDDLGPEIQRLSDLREKMRKAQKNLKIQAKAKADRERKADEKHRRVTGKKERKRNEGPRKEPTPEPENQVNLTDSDSRIMRKNSRSEYRQAYNPQAVVDADGTQLILGNRVSDRVSDSNELEHDLDTVDPEIGSPRIILVDAGYISETEVLSVQGRGVEVLMALGRYEQEGRKHDFRPPREKSPPVPMANGKAWMKAMKEKMEKPESKALYRLRKQTVEPVFGIVKQCLGFRQFLLRGLRKVELEWELVSCAYNLKRLAVLMER